MGIVSVWNKDSNNKGEKTVFISKFKNLKKLLFYTLNLNNFLSVKRWADDENQRQTANQCISH